MDISQNKWMIYQRERFPLFLHAVLIIIFSVSGLSYSVLLRGTGSYPSFSQIAFAFFITLIFFLQIRLLDEFKDYDADLIYHPDRPVPRGIVTLKDIRGMLILSVVVNLVATIFYDVRLVPFLLLVWIYLGLMTAEFFAGEWLKKHLVLYMLSHVMISPVIALFITACDWVNAGVSIPSGLYLFLVATYLNGIVLALSRDILAPGDEKAGEDTYSSIWGYKKAAVVWLFSIFITLVSGITALSAVRVIILPGVILVVVFFVALFTALQFIKYPTRKLSDAIAMISNVWTLVLYICIGVLPLIIKSGL